jgi:hypothetical protein
LGNGLVRGYDCRAADVGLVSRKLWDAVPGDGYPIGSPELLVLETEDDAFLHITHGASAVWVLKPELREVVVITAASRQVYTPGQRIPLPESKTLAVNDIFPV